MPRPNQDPGTRKLKRMQRAIARRNWVRNRSLTAAQRHADAVAGELKYRGMKKIRDLWLRAGVLILPFEDTEVKALLQQAKDEFTNDGLISTDTAMRLAAGGYDIAELERIWTLMKTCEVDEEAVGELARENAQRMPDVEFVEDTGPINNFY